MLFKAYISDDLFQGFVFHIVSGNIIGRIFLCVSELCVCRYLRGPERAVDSGFWEMNLGSLKE